MSEVSTTQTAVDEPKTPAQPGAAGGDAQTNGDDLDTLVKEFETKTAASTADTTTKPEQKSGTSDPSLEQMVDARVEQKLAERQMADDANKFSGELASEFGITTRMAKGWLDQMARDEPAVLDAFLKRKSEPSRWARTWASLKKEFGKEHQQSSVDKFATEDRDAVTAAVRGASTKAPEGKAPDYSGMSNAEFREAHKRDYGYYPPV